MSSLSVLHDLDWTTMFLLFWLMFGLLVYSVANILIIVKKKRQELIDESNSVDDIPLSKRSVSQTNEQKSVSDVLAHKSKVNVVNGADKCCVEWVNKIIKWFYSQNDVTIDSFLNIWINALNNQINKNSKLLTDVSPIYLLNTFPILPIPFLFFAFLKIFN